MRWVFKYEFGTSVPNKRKPRFKLGGLNDAL